MTKTDRIHSLDSLRAVMMILGIVLHSSETYNVGSDGVWTKDPTDTHLFFNYLSSMIHIFRMPIFFTIAGFFGALLYYEKGPISMMRNRLYRIVLPFIVFLLVLNPIVLLALDYTATAFGKTVTEISTTITWLPKITYHLWFLYYLILIALAVFVVAYFAKRTPSLTRRINSIFLWMMTHRSVAIPLFSILIFIMLVWMWDLWAPTPLSFAVDLKVFTFYLFFYLLGWLLFKSKHLLETFMKNDWLFAVIALVIYTSKFILRSYIDDVADGALNAIVIWFFFFGIIGLFMRYRNSHSRSWRYISDSSYWVYLVHLPLTVAIPGLIVDLSLPVAGKFLIVMLSTTIVCFATYHYLVRGTIIGQFLNGRRYTKEVARFDSNQAV